jgi:ACS family tartrate transporter-like MFS transporter
MPSPEDRAETPVADPGRLAIGPLAGLDHPVARSCMRKAAWRLLPLLFCMYIVAYLDRVNAGFAKLQMQDHLGFNDRIYGWGLGLFYVGYLLFEIPGALLVEHWSARKWFARILVTWGLCSMGTALVSTKEEFYIARILLGLAEAGFFPGVIIYFTHWFPREVRARAMSGMLIAVPASSALGSFVSAYLLQLDWFDLQGWQWVFIVEGAPAVLLGLATPFLMPDRPRDARWLTPEERDWLEAKLAEERRATLADGGTTSLGQALKMPAVWLLALGIFATNIGGIGLVSWIASAIKSFLGKESAGADDTQVLLWTGPIFLCGILGVICSGWSSHRTGERKWHCIGAQVTAGLFLVLSAIENQPWELRYVWLCLTGFFANSWFSPYWVLPTLALTSSAAAVSIGIINMSANIPGFLSNYILGQMKDAGYSFSACMRVLAAGFILGGVFVSLVRVRKSKGESKS